MPKEVRLNDKMWFGRWKGKTIKWILDNDMNFLEKLCDRGKISYHKNVVDYLEGGSKYSKKTAYWMPQAEDDHQDEHQEGEQDNGGWGDTPTLDIPQYISSTSPVEPIISSFSKKKLTNFTIDTNINELFGVDIQPGDHPARTGERYVIDPETYNINVEDLQDLKVKVKDNPYEWGFNAAVKASSDLNSIVEVTNPDNFDSWPNNFDSLPNNAEV